MAKKALTEADIVALAAGAAAPADLEAAIKPTDQPQGEGNGVQDEKASEEVGAAAGTPEVVTDAKSPVSQEQVTHEATVQLLNAQLKDKDAQLLEAGIKVAQLQAFKDQYEAVLQPLKDIVARSAHIMHIACGGTTRDFASMQPADLVAEHARLAVGFSKFPVGGVAAVVTDDPKEKSAKFVATNMTQAQINAVRGK